MQCFAANLEYFLPRIFQVHVQLFELFHQPDFNKSITISFVNARNCRKTAYLMILSLVFCSGPKVSHIGYTTSQRAGTGFSMGEGGPTPGPKFFPRRFAFVIITCFRQFSKITTTTTTTTTTQRAATLNHANGTQTSVRIRKC